MSLQRDIIVVNQFSIKRPGGGTKGNTPGDFVLRYMARDGATETLTPVKKQPVDNFITRYMARDNATEQAVSLHDLGHKFNKVQGLGGRSFGKVGREDAGNVSLSDKGIRNASKIIQNAFDHGHTVLETVISFDGNYLKKHGLVDQDISLDDKGHALKRGAYRGKLDQMKLRLAIMQGLDKMSRHKINGKSRFDSLAYVGVIQVDTQQVHCHLAMTDLGRGQLVKTKGLTEQKGVLNKEDRNYLRRGIDNKLDQYQTFKRLSLDVARERQNTRSYVKRYTQKAMQQSSFATIVLAALPNDKRLWRANSNNRQMQQANSIMRFYVDQVLQKPKSGYNKAMEKVNDYAKMRQKRENLNDHDYRKLINNGQKQIQNRCINSVYDLLKKVPEQDKTVSSRVIDGLTDSLANLRAAQNTKPKDPELEFTYHLRVYTKRLDRSRKKAKQFNKLEQNYENAQFQNKTSKDSLVVSDFYKEERDYYSKIVCKYQTLMPLMARRSRMIKWLKRLKDLREKLRKMRQMLDDNLFNKLSSKNAEKYGLDRYNEKNGHLIKDNLNVFSRLIKRQELNYHQAQDSAKLEANEHNKSLDFNKNGEAKFVSRLPYKFGDIKGLDLHECIDDDDDLKFSQKVTHDFVNSARKRRDLFLKTVQYASNTNQPQILQAVDAKDIQKMNDLADKLQQNQQIKQKRSQSAPVKIRQKKTVSLDNQLSKQMQEQILQTLDTIDQIGPSDFDEVE